MKKIVIILMLINSIAIFGQNVGIGTTNPQSKLHVVGQIAADSLAIGVPSPSAKVHINGDVKIEGGNTIEFGAGIVPKDGNAGKIGYKTFSNGLDVIGAGTNNSDRKITFFNEGGATFNGSAIIHGSVWTDSIAVGIQTPSAKVHIDGDIKIEGSNTIEFGAGVAPKEGNAGKIGYQTFSTGLDVIGAGTNNTNRKITFYNEGGATFNGSTRIYGSLRPDSLNIVSNGGPSKLINVSTPPAQSIDQQNSKGGFSSAASNAPANWQSFTAGQTGFLRHIAIGVSDPTGPKLLRIYEGLGTGGAILHENIWSSITNLSLSPEISIPITAGNVYTIWFSNSNHWWLNGSNTYSGGQSLPDVNRDFVFITYVSTTNTPNPLLTFRNNGNLGIGIDSASTKLEVAGKTKTDNLQITNGAGNNRILTSDANGNASWSNSIRSILTATGANSQILIEETDNANKQWKIEGNNRNFGITETGLATALLINEGADNSALVISNDTTSLKKLQVGASGTALTKMQNGTFNIGSHNFSEFKKEITVPFPTSFGSIPRLVANVQNETSALNDEFIVTIKAITVSNATFIIRRIDSSAPVGWGQNPKLNWWAFE